MQKKILILLFTLVVAFVFCGAASAAPVKTNQISTAKINNVGIIDTHYQKSPSIDGNKIVWVQDNGYVANNIYLKDLKTGKNSKISSYGIDPDISGNKIVYVIPSPKGSYINVKDLKTGKTGTIVKSKSYDIYAIGKPAISGNIVVWQQRNAYMKGYSLKYTNFLIYYKNLITGKHGILLKSAHDQTNPDIYGNTVVWEQKGVIFYKNLATNKFGIINTKAHTMVYPHISGNIIVWNQDNWNNELYGYQWFIYMKNLKTGTITKIISDNQKDSNYIDAFLPNISGNIIVWEEGGTKSTYIYMKNLKTGKISQITTEPIYHGYTPPPEDFYYYDQNPVISGNIVVWMREPISDNDQYSHLYFKDITNGNIHRIK